MKEKTILVIDDSATIRRLCDGELSNAGYQVLLAPTAEEGVATAQDKSPDLIVLDHQLPGTTGYEVCCQLLAIPETARIPIVASSTLRKKAYAEYVDCDNVVDMLPKPYTPEALIATVESALSTAEMVVQSQCDGSAVPEVIDELGESDLAGAFGCFGLREVLDLLNNGQKSGMLEVDTGRARVYVFVNKGRVQAVTASGVDPAEVARYMPPALSELGPVIKLTVAGRRGSEVDGLVELLNNKVLDPRLLKKLLRLQAAVLLRFCFTADLKCFRFEQNQSAPPLFQKLPLDGSLLSLLVEGAMVCEEEQLPHCEAGAGYVRKPIRGQSMDRAGLSSRHMRLLSVLSEPVSLNDLASKLDWPVDEVRRVAHGFELADLVEQSKTSKTKKIFGVFSDVELGRKVHDFVRANKQDVSGKLVRDWLALRLLFRRSRPEVLVFEVNEDLSMLEKLVHDPAKPLSGVKVVGIGHWENDTDPAELGIDLVLPKDFQEQQLLDILQAGQDSAQAGSESGSNPGLPVADLDSTSALPVATNVEG